MAIRLKLLALAALSMEKGVKEESPNWGKRVSQYLRNADIHEPAPWCAAVQQFVTDQAAHDHGLVNPLDAVLLEAYVPSYVEFAVKNGLIVKDPTPGDLVCFNFGGKRWDHVGMVRGVGKTIIDTIEGNTNDAGSREGYIVAAKERSRSLKTTYISWDRGLTAEPLPHYKAELAKLGFKVP